MGDEPIDSAAEALAGVRASVAASRAGRLAQDDDDAPDEAVQLELDIEAHGLDMETAVEDLRARITADPKDREMLERLMGADRVRTTDAGTVGIDLAHDQKDVGVCREKFDNERTFGSDPITILDTVLDEWASLPDKWNIAGETKPYMPGGLPEGSIESKPFQTGGLLQGKYPWKLEGSIECAFPLAIHEMHLCQIEPYTAGGALFTWQFTCCGKDNRSIQAVSDTTLRSFRVPISCITYHTSCPVCNQQWSGSYWGLGKILKLTPPL